MRSRGAKAPVHEWEFETMVVVRFRTDGERVWPVAAAPLGDYPAGAPAASADEPDDGPRRFRARRVAAALVALACLATGGLAVSRPQHHAGSPAVVTSVVHAASEASAEAPEMDARTAGMDPDAYEHWL